MAEPNRTPGKAEGTVQNAKQSGSGAENQVGKAGKTSLPHGEPKRTPDKAEGEVQDAENSLRKQEQKRNG